MGRRVLLTKKNTNPNSKNEKGEDKGTNSNVASNMNDKVEVSSDKSQKTPSESL